VGSSSGSFLNRLRLSPSGKESRPYPIQSGDIIQLGVDYQGRQDGKLVFSSRNIQSSFN
jgi:pSer/pThr/pTyr-binding forkhead associated (FHA) protein